jgi:hypothetical protein
MDPCSKGKGNSNHESTEENESTETAAKSQAGGIVAKPRRYGNSHFRVRFLAVLSLLWVGPG